MRWYGWLGLLLCAPLLAQVADTLWQALDHPHLIFPAVVGLALIAWAVT